jgi:hypothetical protein
MPMIGARGMQELSGRWRGSEAPMGEPGVVSTGFYALELPWAGVSLSGTASVPRIWTCGQQSTADKRDEV